MSLAGPAGRAWAALDGAAGRRVSAGRLGERPGRVGLRPGQRPLAGVVPAGRRAARPASGTTKAAVVDKLRDLHAQLDKGVTPKAG